MRAAHDRGITAALGRHCRRIEETLAAQALSPRAKTREMMPARATASPDRRATMHADDLRRRCVAVQNFFRRSTDRRRVAAKMTSTRANQCE
jgi:hypothetical protein